MSRGRKQVHIAGLFSIGAHILDSTTVSARITDGPQDVIGRTAVLYLTDDEVLDVLATLAVRPRFAAAIRAAAQDETVRDAAEGTVMLGDGGRRRKLRGQMGEAVHRIRAEAGDQPS